jgi:outer membrane murein-binding lipoprotein Lpp
MTPAKPVDLATARKRAGTLAEQNMHSTAATIRDMADEIEALRDAVTDLFLADTAAQLHAARARLRALLPPS